MVENDVDYNFDFKNEMKVTAIRNPITCFLTQGQFFLRDEKSSRRGYVQEGLRFLPDFKTIGIFGCLSKKSSII